MSAATFWLVCGTLAVGCGAHASPSSTPHASHAHRTLEFIDPVDVAGAPRGALWVADYRDSAITVLRRRGAALTVVRRFPAPGGPNRLAVARSGVIWAAMWDAGTLQAWAPGGRTARPVVTIHARGLRQPTGLGFDPRGWLWVTTQKGRSLLGFSPGRLRRSGRVVPSREIALPGGAQALNEDVAFDLAGRAYVVQYQAEKVIVFDSLKAGSLAARTISLRGDGPVGARRGPDGAIWVTNSTAANVLRLSDGGRRRRTIEIAGANMPHTITFAGGEAWVTDPTAWLLAYPVDALRSDSAKPDAVAHR
jgi:streptogramin lyase